MQTDSGKWAGIGVKMDGENNGQGVVQGPDLYCCLTRHSMTMAPPTQWEYSPCLAPSEQSQGHLPGGQGQAWAGGRAGEQGDGAPLLQKEHKTLQQPETLVFVFKLLPQESCPERTWTVP